MYKLTDEQRYRLELAKDRAPTTDSFLWWIPLFLFIAWMCREPIAQSAPVILLQPESHHSNPMPETSLKVLGWELL